MCSIIFSLIPSSRSSSGVDCERSKSSACRSSQQSFGLCPSASSMSVKSVFRRDSSSTGRSVQCAPIPMPLPKSVTCSSCKKTYPEGWKRCPYCGFDESRAKAESQARRYMQQKLREWESRTGKSQPRREERGERDRPRPQQRGDRRPQQQQQQQQKQGGRDRDQRQQQQHNERRQQQQQQRGGAAT